MTTKIEGGDELEKPVISKRDILDHLEAQSKTLDNFKIGMEYERLGVHVATGKALSYTEGIEPILNTLAETDGWEKGLENDRIIFLQKDDNLVTLEPGGRTEFTSRPCRTIEELMKDANSFRTKLDKIAAEQDAVFLGMGFQPFTSIDEIEWVPKTRYKYMAPFLSETGTMAHEMMKQTAGVQVALDYSNLDDAMRKLRAASLCTPFAQALFASSSIINGKAEKEVCRRGRIWQKTDSARCDIPPFFIDPNSTMDDYAEWILHMPLMFLERDGVYSEAEGRCLGDLVSAGEANIYDLEIALTQAFPEVRFKRFVEIRSLDSPQPMSLASAACFWSSLLYGDLDAIFDLLGGLTHEVFEELRAVAISEGLKGRVGERTIGEWTLDLLAIATQNSTCISSMKNLQKRAEMGLSASDAAADLLAEVASPSEFVSQWNDHRWW
ncbi:MAG: hypothetical protein JKX97_01875 [Candidatus Lindowbacteria bacterium]|nr:hypothetical protein [Candidatus Lindowbacteria bacterium]